MKKTAIGFDNVKIEMIPKEWDIKKLADISGFITKGATPTTYGFNWSEDGVIFLKSDCVSDNGFVIGENLYISEKAHEYMSRSKVTNGDILISITGNIGRVALLPNYINEANINQHIARIRVIDKGISNKFIYYQLSRSEVKKDYEKIKTGLAYPQISLEQVRNTKVVIPSLQEQEKIVEILSTWDLAIEKQEQLIEKKKEFKKGLMQKLYSEGTKKEERVKTKLGEVPISWNVIKAKEIFKSVSIKNNENEELLSVTQDRGTIPRNELEGNVVMPEGSTKGYKLVVPNNFIISLRSFQGGLEISEHRGIISPAYTVLENKIDICHDYFKYYFKKEEFISRLNGAVVGIRDGKQISYTDFGEIYLPLPSVDEQKKIAEILTLSDKEIELLEKELEVLKLQKKGLMQRLLTGEVRVKV